MYSELSPMERNLRRGCDRGFGDDLARGPAPPAAHLLDALVEHLGLLDGQLPTNGEVVERPCPDR
jgi:hypothetical protein